MSVKKKTVLWTAAVVLVLAGALFANKETREMTARLASKGVLTLREGEKELTYEEYLVVLDKWNKRKAKADSLIKIEEDLIAQLQADIEETERLKEQTLQETYDMLGITQADVDALDEAIMRLTNKVDELDTYSAAELQEKEEDIKGVEAEHDSLSKLPAAMLFKQAADLEMLGERIAGIRARKDNYVPPKPPEPEGYTVVRGDWLSKLAEYEDVYGKGNFHMWTKIFQANRDLIVSAYKRSGNAKYDKPEDLIFPEQVLKIPR